MRSIYIYIYDISSLRVNIAVAVAEVGIGLLIFTHYGVLVQCNVPLVLLVTAVEWWHTGTECYLRCRL